jgi:hypothetical protein
MAHGERHRTARVGWLRAAVLGANDGLISTGSLIVGVASAAAPREDVLLAGLAGLIAGALSMAAGEYVSVGSRPIPSAPTSRASAESWRRRPPRSARSWRRSMSPGASSRGWPARSPIG